MRKATITQTQSKKSDPHSDIVFEHDDGGHLGEHSEASMTYGQAVPSDIDLAGMWQRPKELGERCD